MNSQEPVKDNTSTSAPPCEYSGCTRAAEQKCSKCGNIFCYQHVQLTVAFYTCDLCVARAAQAQEEETTRMKHARQALRLSEDAYRQSMKADQARRATRMTARREIRTLLLWSGIALCLAGILLLYYSRDSMSFRISSSAWVPAACFFWAGIMLLLVQYWLRER